MTRRITETDSRLRPRWFGWTAALPPWGLPVTVCGALWAQTEQSLLYRLAPHQRVKVMAALAVVVLLGLGLILFAWWGARAIRRHSWRSHDISQTGRGQRLREDDWATKPLVSEPDSRPDAED